MKYKLKMTKDLLAISFLVVAISGATTLYGLWVFMKLAVNDSIGFFFLGHETGFEKVSFVFDTIMVVGSFGAALCLFTLRDLFRRIFLAILALGILSNVVNIIFIVWKRGIESSDFVLFTIDLVLSLFLISYFTSKRVKSQFNRDSSVSKTEVAI
ncbi:MAG: hypothetical protein P8X67_02345 [Syntrophobacterales bacterium]|jgi:hypothetical protein